MSGSGSVSGGGDDVDWTKRAKTIGTKNGGGRSETIPMSINYKRSTRSGGGGFRMGGLLHLPRRFPRSPCSEGGPEIETRTPMGGPSIAT